MHNSKISVILRSIESFTVQIILLFIAFSLSLISSRVVGHFLVTKSSNGILNSYLPSYNPSENIFKILWVLVFTVLIYLFLHNLSKTHKLVFRYVFMAIMVLVVFTTKIIPDATKNFGNLDTFHHGEQLSPANAFLNGKNPVTQMYVLHGIGEDVILPSLALKLSTTNHGIGSYYFMVATLNLISAMMFFILLSNLFRRNSVFMLISAWFAFGSGTFFWYTRDIFTWSILLLVYYLLTHERISKRKSILLSGALGLLASSALIYSFDRGIIGCCIIFTYYLLTFVTWRVPNKTSGYSFRLSFSVDKLRALIFATCGFLVPFAIIIIGSGLSGLAAFAKTYFLSIPRNQGLMFNYPMPSDINSTNLWIWAPIILGSLTIFMLLQMYKYRVEITGRHVFAIIMVTTSILLYQLGYGRYDQGHVGYAVPVILLSALYVLGLCIRDLKSINKEERAHFIQVLMMPTFLIIALFIGYFIAYAPGRYYAFSSANPRIAKDYFGLPSKPDTYWEPDQVEKVTAYVKDNTHPDESIFVFTNQPIYYYLTNRNNPTRYYIPWFADPNDQEKELLRSLINDPPSLVIYSAGNTWDAPDGYPMSARTPEVNKWLLINYTQAVDIDGVTILRHP